MVAVRMEWSWLTGAAKGAEEAKGRGEYCPKKLCEEEKLEKKDRGRPTGF